MFKHQDLQMFCLKLDKILAIFTLLKLWFGVARNIAFI